jgi:hypothetical protein
MRFRFASSHLVLFEFGSFHRLIEMPFSSNALYLALFLTRY